MNGCMQYNTVATNVVDRYVGQTFARTSNQRRNLHSASVNIVNVCLYIMLYGTSLNIETL